MEDHIKIYLKQDGFSWTGLIWLGTGTSGGLMWTQNRAFGFHKCGEFLDQQGKYWVLKPDLAPWS
jgi:hypothetical protein